MDSPFKQDVLAGKVALITGGGSGICKGIAKTYAEHGATVVIMGRRAEVLQATVEEFTKAGLKADFVQGDVRSMEAAEAAASQCFEKHGRLDVLINGAAGNFLCPTEALSPNGFKTVIEIDLLGTFHMSQAARPLLAKTGDALILNISATLHYKGTPMQSHVMAAKAGIDALSKNLAVEWAEKGIRVNNIAPGPIGDTEGMRRLAPLGADKRIAAAVPLKRLGRVEDIAYTALFLATNAASYINGETIVVDGGEWIQTTPFIDRDTWDKISQADRKSP